MDGGVWVSGELSTRELGEFRAWFEGDDVEPSGGKGQSCIAGAGADVEDAGIAGEAAIFSRTSNSASG
jgi:hypothetical protein